MADDVAVIICDKCGAKLKVKAIALKVLKEIKCGKCGAKIPVKKDPPVSTESTPIPISSSAVAPNPPAPNRPAEHVSAPKPAPPIAAASGTSDELNRARARISELEMKLAAASSAGANDELKKAHHEIEEQAQRISELQQLWMQKEKETREAYDRADKANKDRLEAVGERERVVVAIKEVLTSYHIAEIEGAKKRMAELDQRIQSFLAMARMPPASG